MVRNLLNDTRALTFKLQATICREVDFQILSPLPISLGSFPLSTAGQGFVKLLNPTARDLSYTVSAQNVELLLGDSYSAVQGRSSSPHASGSEGGTQTGQGGTQGAVEEIRSSQEKTESAPQGTQSTQNGTQSTQNETHSPQNGTQSPHNGTQSPPSNIPIITPSPPHTAPQTAPQTAPHAAPSLEIPAKGYEACVEVRRARVTSSALRPDEREHLESSVGPPRRAHA